MFQLFSFPFFYRKKFHFCSVFCYEFFLWETLLNTNNYFAPQHLGSLSGRFLAIAETFYRHFDRAGTIYFGIDPIGHLRFFSFFQRLSPVCSPHQRDKRSAGSDSAFCTLQCKKTRAPIIRFTRRTRSLQWPDNRNWRTRFCVQLAASIVVN